MTMTRAGAIALLALVAPACSEARDMRPRWTPEVAQKFALIAGGECLDKRETLCVGRDGEFTAHVYPEAQKINSVDFMFRARNLEEAKATITRTVGAITPPDVLEGLFVRMKVPGKATMNRSGTTMNARIGETYPCGPKSDRTDPCSPPEGPPLFDVNVSILWTYSY